MLHLELLAGVFLAASAPASTGADRATSVVLIVADDLGIDRVGCYGDPLARTPHLDRLAAGGTRFETCWAAPRCSPGRGMIFTGQYPFRTGIGDNVKLGFALDPSIATLADLLPGDRGQLLGKWHLSLDLDDPAAKGFEHRGTIRNLSAFDGDYYRWAKNDVGSLGASVTYATTDSVDEAIRALDHRLVVLSLNAPHAPFQVPPGDLHSYGEPTDVARRYRAMVEAMDQEIGRLLAAIAAHGSRPLILFTADNGTPGDAAEPGENPARMKGSLYEGGLRVPLILSGPDIPIGRVETRLTSVVDVFATMLERTHATGVAPSDSVPALGLAPRSWIFSEAFQPNGPPPYDYHRRAIRGARYKLIRKKEGCFDCDELYDLWNDPQEKLDLLLGTPSAEVRAVYLRLAASMPS